MLQSVNTKLQGMIAAAFLLTAAGIILVMFQQSSRIHVMTNDRSESLRKTVADIVRDRENNINDLKIEAILTRLKNAEKALSTTVNDLGLSGTDMAKQYEEEAKTEVLNSIRKNYYGDSPAGNLTNRKVYPFIVDGQGLVVLHPRLKTGDTSLQNLPFSRQMINASEPFFPYEYQNEKKYMFVRKMQEWDWRVGFAVPEDLLLEPAIRMEQSVTAFEKDIENSIGSLLKVVVIVVITIAVLSVIVLGVLIRRSVSRPIAAAVDQLDAIATKGDLSSEVPAEYLNRRDEIGRLSQAMQGLIDFQRKEQSMAGEMAVGNWDLDIPLRSDRDELGKALRAMTEQVNDTLSRVRSAVEEVNSGSMQIADASQTLSQGATESAASLEEITSSMTEIGSQIKLNAENAHQANQLAGAARGAAENGSARMDEMTAAMNEINASSQQIAKIIKTIDDIAFQTNLLALNAAVEAARAGKHGKGFAVVAQEVRSLAGRSAVAAQETAQLIESSNSKVRKGTQIAGQTSTALAEIVTGITKAADLVSEIASASNEQAQGIAQVSQGLGQIDSVTQQNTASAEETASSAEELSGQAQELKQLLSRFRLKTGNQTMTSPETESHLLT
ncbi:MAG: HAMP domain-containing protein [Desulfobacteraceae bacterium]|nr:MAG: HAMP domain-containing protein [Desulfobacteraceae bacterium]